MKIENLALGEPIVNCVATIGSFDGVHRGHQCLLSQVRHIADERGLRAMAITFGTSPRRVLGMDDSPQLTSVKERTTLLRQCGMDEVAVLDFTRPMAEMTARDFMLQVLKEQLGVEVLVIGYDHRFGHGRSEGFDDYVRYGEEMGIEVVRGEACTDGGEPVSSTRIRHLLTEGNVKEAAHLLGYLYTLQGEVVGGYREGRKMGFPTANLQPLYADKLLPTDGVYAVRVFVGQQTTDNRQQTTDKVATKQEQRLLAGSVERSNFNEVNGKQTDNCELSIVNCQLNGMLNIGRRPTMNNGAERSIEVHILDFNGELYGKSLTVEFVHRLREEQTFGSVEQLAEQLRRDEVRVRRILNDEKE